MGIGLFEKQISLIDALTFLTGVFREFFIYFFAGTQTSLSNINFLDNKQMTYNLNKINRAHYLVYCGLLV